MIGIELPVSRSRRDAADNNTSASVETTRYAGTSLVGDSVGEDAPLITRSTGPRVVLPPEASREALMSADAVLETGSFFFWKALISWCADVFANTEPVLPILPSLPVVFCRVGIIPGVVLIVLVGVLATSTLSLREEESFSATRWREQCVPVLPLALASVASMSISIFQFGTLVAAQVLLREIAASVVNLVHARSLLLALIVLLSAPFWLRLLHCTVGVSITQHAESMRRALGMMSFIFFCLILSLRAFQRSQLPHAHQHVEWVSAQVPSQFCLELLVTFPIVLICFTAALVPESFPLQQERVVASLHWRIAVFCFVGITGYVFAGRETLDNVWLNLHPTDGLARCCKVVYCGFLWLFIPHICQQAILSTMAASNGAARNTVTADVSVRCKSDFFMGAGAKINSDVDGSLSEEERNLTQRRSTQSPPVEPRETAISPLLLLFSTFTIAVFVRRLAYLWGLLGSTVGILLCFILPTCRFQMIKSEGFTRHWMPCNLSAPAWIILSSFLFLVLCTTETLRK
jgi:Transmembrane amino acid transporter protein